MSLRWNHQAAPIAAAFLEEAIAAGGDPSSPSAAQAPSSGPGARPSGRRAERGPRRGHVVPLRPAEPRHRRRPRGWPQIEM